MHLAEPAAAARELELARRLQMAESTPVLARMTRITRRSEESALALTPQLTLVVEEEPVQRTEHRVEVPLTLFTMAKGQLVAMVDQGSLHSVFQRLKNSTVRQTPVSIAAP
jgi:hypothetical protein